MSRKSLLTILILAFAAASFWFFSLKKDLKKTQELLTDQQQQQQMPPPKVVTRSVASEVKSEKRQQLEAELGALQKSLDQEQQKLDEQKRTLSTLRQQQSEEVKNHVDYASQIGSRDQQIQDLQSQLRDYGRAGLALNRRAVQDLRVDDAATKAASDQLDENIRQQEELIRRTQAELDYWNLNFNYYPARELHLDELNTLLSAQQQRLADMRTQRLTLSTTLALQTQATQSEAQNVTADYSESQDNIYDEIVLLQDEISNLEKAEMQARNDRVTLSSQINQTLRESQTQARQVKSLEDNIGEKKAELDKLRE